jgi:hypothetical protein
LRLPPSQASLLFERDRRWQPPLPAHHPANRVLRQESRVSTTIPDRAKWLFFESPFRSIFFLSMIFSESRFPLFRIMLHSAATLLMAA